MKRKHTLMHTTAQPRGLTLEQLAKKHDISTLTCTCWGCRMMRCGMCAGCANKLDALMRAQLPEKQSNNPDQEYKIDLSPDFMCSPACRHAFARWYKGRGWENLHPELVGQTAQ